MSGDLSSMLNDKSEFLSSENYPWLAKYPLDISWDLDIHLKPVWMLLEDSALRIPHRPCVDFLGKKYTYGQILSLVNRVAKGLQDLGVQKGDKIGVFMPNSVYYVIMYHGILKAGGVVVNYNPLYSDNELTYQIKDSDTKMIATLDLKFLYDKLHKQLDVPQTPLQKLIVCPFSPSLPWIKRVLFRVFKARELSKISSNPNIIFFNGLTNNDGNVTRVGIDPKRDIAVLQYTGGTTGVPKGAMLSHGNVYANACQTETWVVSKAFGEDRTLVALPLFHVYAMTAAMNLPLRIGCEMYMMFPRFDVEKAIKSIEKNKITLFPGVPTMYGMINQHELAKKADMSSLKICLSGGAALPLQVKEEFERITGGKLTEAYGLSETSPGATANPVKGLPKKGSIGVPFPQTVIKILSLEDTVDGKSVAEVREMPFGEKGQIAIKGPQVMLGYWRRPSETAKSFCGDYFLTGDIGYMDEDGYTFLVDRLKDLIICSGFNVYPRIVEEAIYRHPAVSEVTVIGIPDEKRGETVKAFVKLRPQKTLTENDLLEFLKTELSPIEIPKYIEFRKELPKTMIGKLSKKELKAEENKG